MSHSTQQKLVRAAVTLFRKRGYTATGIAEILTLANVPKGSLYHHFPGGKHDLAIAVAHWSSDQVLELITQTFEETRKRNGTFKEGVILFCEKVADLFEADDGTDFSPVTSTLLDGTQNKKFQETAIGIFDEWKKALIEQGVKFGMMESEIQIVGDKLQLLLEGAWVISRTIGDSKPIRQATHFIAEAIPE